MNISDIDFTALINKYQSLIIFHRRFHLGICRNCFSGVPFLRFAEIRSGGTGIYGFSSLF